MGRFAAWRRHWLVLALGMFGGATLVDAALAEEPHQAPACIRFWPEARPRAYAYDHVVHILNACAAQAICAVSSDVTPTPVRTVVPEGQEVEVMLSEASPVREFVPRVQCGLVI